MLMAGANVQKVETVKQSGPLGSLGTWVHAEDEDCEAVGTVKQSM